MGCTNSTLTESVAITRTNTSATTPVRPGVPSEFDGLGLNPLRPPPNAAQDVSRLHRNNSHRDITTSAPHRTRRVTLVESSTGSGVVSLLGISLHHPQSKRRHVEYRQQLEQLGSLIDDRLSEWYPAAASTSSRPRLL
jgi:hypothetical protein